MHSQKCWFNAVSYKIDNNPPNINWFQKKMEFVCRIFVLKYQSIFQWQRLQFSFSPTAHWQRKKKTFLLRMLSSGFISMSCSRYRTISMDEEIPKINKQKYWGLLVRSVLCFFFISITEKSTWIIVIENVKTISSGIFLDFKIKLPKFSVIHLNI